MIEKFTQTFANGPSLWKYTSIEQKVSLSFDPATGTIKTKHNESISNLIWLPTSGSSHRRVCALWGLKCEHKNTQFLSESFVHKKNKLHILIFLFLLSVVCIVPNGLLLPKSSQQILSFMWFLAEYSTRTARNALVCKVENIVEANASQWKARAFVIYSRFTNHNDAQLFIFHRYCSFHRAHLSAWLDQTICKNDFHWNALLWK